MKARQSLVSNSSSCSFILIGIPIKIEQLHEQHIEIDKNKPRAVIFGRDLCDAQDVFELVQKEQLDFIREYPKLFERAFIYADIKYDGDEMPLKDIVLMPDVQIDKLVGISGMADQNSSRDINTLVENYLDDVADILKEKTMKQFKAKYGIKCQDYQINKLKI